MRELLPCPFCGGETELKRYKCGDWQIICYHGDGCIMREDLENGYFEDADLQTVIRAWNSRAERETDDEWEIYQRSVPATEENMAKFGWVRERTCHNASHRLDESRFHCSECGFGCWVKNVATGRDELPNHCPNCGAKVVSE